MMKVEVRMGEKFDSNKNEKENNSNPKTPLYILGVFLESMRSRRALTGLLLLRKVSHAQHGIYQMRLGHTHLPPERAS